MNKIFSGHDLAVPFSSVAAQLRRHRDRHPDKTALVDLDQGSRLTWAELEELAARVSGFLLKAGIAKGDRVALLGGETIEKLILWLGAWRIGAVVCPLNIEIGDHHLRALLTLLAPKLVLHEAAADLASVAEAIDAPRFRYAGWLAASGPEAEDEIFRKLPSRESAADAPENGPLDEAAFFVTSGTTSLPKLVHYDHTSYWLNGLSVVDFIGLEADDRSLEYRSFGWNSAQVTSLLPLILVGNTLHLARKFSISRFPEWVRQYGITFAAGVPTVLAMMMEREATIDRSDIATLRRMTCSTAPLTVDQWNAFEATFGIPILQAYGMSEAGFICGNRHYKRKVGTVGPAVKHITLDILDPAGNPLPAGVEGEITVGGSQLSRGVLHLDGRFEPARGTRLKTGDLGVRDEDGFVRITGRIKDLIIRGGVNIAPLEIDTELLRIPDVSEAATVGIPDPIYGEEVVGYVVLRPGSTTGRDDVLRTVSERLPAYKAPKQIYVVDSMPRSDRGKILRERLKQQWLRDNDRHSLRATQARS